MSVDPLEVFADRLGEPGPEQAMIAACRRLVNDTGQLEPPISLSAIGRRLGVSVAYDETTGDGSVHAVGDGFVVRLRHHGDGRHRSGGPPELQGTWRRARFTLAHELGHVVLMRALPPGIRVALASPEYHDSVERLCNLGAAEMLMPAERFEFDLLQSGWSPHGLADLHDLYRVSWSTLIVRLSEVLNANVSMWRSAERPHERDVLRVVASFGGPGWLPRGLSDRYLSQPVVHIGLRDGVAACLRLSSTHDRADDGSLAVAAVVPTRHSHDAQLLRPRSSPLRGEHPGRDQVLLLRLPASDRERFDLLRRADPLDANDDALVPSPLAMAIPATA